MPLLIGGATTSRVHTAVKISPNYSARPGDLCARRQPRRRRRLQAAVADGAAPATSTASEAEYVKVARSACSPMRRDKKRITLAAARANKFKIDWTAYTPPKPTLPRRARRSRTTIWPSWCRYIDWTPFFQTWELTGRYPRSWTTTRSAPKPQKLFADAQAMLKRIVAEKWLTREGGGRLLAGQQRRRRHRALHRRERAA